mmetsp:Transcript_63917/g.187487  ORF Transcript_63917/g.187487 Transcript_63917/m.187487 type:complete len:275 (+) Transcript_63917:22-846(+)
MVSPDCGPDFDSSFIVAFAKSSETRSERILKPWSKASGFASDPPPFSTCRTWLQMTAAALWRMSASRRRRAAMLASAALMSWARGSEITARVVASDGALFDAVMLIPVMPRPATPMPVKPMPVAPSVELVWRKSSVDPMPLDSQVRVQRLSKRSCFVRVSIASMSVFTGWSAFLLTLSRLSSASSIRISTWAQFTSTSSIQVSSGSEAPSSFCRTRGAPCRIISLTHRRSTRPSVMRPSWSWSFSSLMRRSSRRRTLKSRSSMSSFCSLRCTRP